MKLLIIAILITIGLFLSRFAFNISYISMSFAAFLSLLIGFGFNKYQLPLFKGRPEVQIIFQVFVISLVFSLLMIFGQFLFVLDPDISSGSKDIWIINWLYLIVLFFASQQITTLFYLVKSHQLKNTSWLKIALIYLTGILLVFLLPILVYFLWLVISLQINKLFF